MRTTRCVGLVLCAGAAALYAAACACPAAVLGAGEAAVPGWAAFLLGSVIVAGMAPPCAGTLVALSWLANPVAVAGVVCLGRGGRAAGAACGLAGLGLGLLFFVPTAVQPRAGAYLWAGSLAALAAGAVLVWAGGPPGAGGKGHAA